MRERLLEAVEVVQRLADIAAEIGEASVEGDDLCGIWRRRRIRRAGLPGEFVDLDLREFIQRERQSVKEFFRGRRVLVQLACQQNRRFHVGGGHSGVGEGSLDFLRLLPDVIRLHVERFGMVDIIVSLPELRAAQQRAEER